jgi:hypothetical protein
VDLPVHGFFETDDILGSYETVMRKIKIVIFVFLGLGILIGFLFLLVSLLRPKLAGIHIESNPASAVFLNGQEVGRTPYENTREQGEVIVKLVPDSFETPLVPYETKINLVAGVQTVIKRDFGETDDASSGEIISFEKVDSNQTSLAVVSIPDSSEVLIDEKERAFTPHRTSSLLPGEHTLSLSSEGYRERTVAVRTHEGYKLTAVVKLAKVEGEQGEDAEIQPEPEVQEAEEKTAVKRIKILSTPTGYLRVRNEPSTLGTEVGRVEPGKTYDLLETDEKTGWYKIKFSNSQEEEEKAGWITNQYAEVEGTATVSPTRKPSPTLQPTP